MRLLQFFVMSVYVGHRKIDMCSMSLCTSNLMIGLVVTSRRCMSSSPCVVIEGDVFRTLKLSAMVVSARSGLVIRIMMLLRRLVRLLILLVHQPMLLARLLMFLVLVLEVTTVLLFQHIIMRITFLLFFTLTHLVLIRRFSLDRDNLGWDIVLSRVKFLYVIRFHFEDKMARVDVRL